MIIVHQQVSFSGVTLCVHVRWHRRHTNNDGFFEARICNHALNYLVTAMKFASRAVEVTTAYVTKLATKMRIAVAFSLVVASTVSTAGSGVTHFGFVTVRLAVWAIKVLFTVPALWAYEMPSAFTIALGIAAAVWCITAGNSGAEDAAVVCKEVWRTLTSAM